MSMVSDVIITTYYDKKLFWLTIILLGSTLLLMYIFEAIRIFIFFEGKKLELKSQ
jgi:hypothetical protein